MILQMEFQLPYSIPSFGSLVLAVAKPKEKIPSHLLQLLLEFQGFSIS